MEITMKEALKSRGWTLEQMAERMNCSISQISKIQNGVVPITENMQSKFQEVFPNLTLINSAEKWKEKYQELEIKYLKLLAKATDMQEELNNHREIFAKMGKTLLEVGTACDMNSENVNDYNLPEMKKSTRRKLLN